MLESSVHVKVFTHSVTKFELRIPNPLLQVYVSWEPIEYVADVIDIEPFETFAFGGPHAKNIQY